VGSSAYAVSSSGDRTGRECFKLSGFLLPLCRCARTGFLRLFPWPDDSKVQWSSEETAERGYGSDEFRKGNFWGAGNKDRLIAYSVSIQVPTSLFSGELVDSTARLLGKNARGFVFALFDVPNHARAPDLFGHHYRFFAATAPLWPAFLAHFCAGPPSPVRFTRLTPVERIKLIETHTGRKLPAYLGTGQEWPNIRRIESHR
jgi:hypothetical protein